MRHYNSTRRWARRSACVQL